MKVFSMATPIILLLAITSLQCENKRHTTIYVSSESENDGNGSYENPYSDINNAVKKLAPGDTLRLLPGTFSVKETIKFVNQGLPGKPIIFMGSGKNETIIDAMLVHQDSLSNAAFWIAGKHLALQNITVQNSHSVGIYVGGKTTNSKHISISDCLVKNTYGSGIGIWYVDSISVKYNEIIGANDQEMRSPGVPLRRESPHEALTVAGATHFEVAHNEVHHCVKEGIDVKEVSKYGKVHHNYIHHLERQGLYADAWFGLLKDVTFKNNLVHDCEWGVVVSVEGKGSKVEDIYIHDNLLHNNRGSGIFFGQWGHDLLRENIQVFNNTVFNNGSENHWAGTTGGIDIRSMNAKKVRVYNNITASNHSFEIATFSHPDSVETTLKGKDILIENNLLESPKFTPPVRTKYNMVWEYIGTNNMIASPQFVNAKGSDFRLKQKSLAKHASINSNTNRDLGANIIEIETMLTDLYEHRKKLK